MDILIVLYSFILGAIFASFCSAIAWRVSEKGGKEEYSIWTGRSVCPSCKKQLPWWALIPIFSYIFLRGKCFNCKKKISIYYFLAEVISGFFLSLVALRVLHGEIDIWQGFIFIFAYYVLLVLSFQDLWFEEISDKIALPAIIIIFVSQFSYFILNNNTETFIWMFVTLAVTLLIFGSIVIFSNAMGGGDLRVFALISFIFSFELVLLVFTIAFTLASFGGITTAIINKKKNYLTYHVRLIPYMLLGVIIVFIFSSFFKSLLLGV